MTDPADAAQRIAATNEYLQPHFPQRAGIPASLTTRVSLLVAPDDAPWIDSSIETTGVGFADKSYNGKLVAITERTITVFELTNVPEELKTQEGDITTRTRRVQDLNVIRTASDGRIALEYTDSERLELPLGHPSESKVRDLLAKLSFGA